MQRLSDYAESLPSDAKARYEEKLKVIGGIDPFQAGNVGELNDGLPDVDAADLVSTWFYKLASLLLNSLRRVRVLKLIINL